MEDRSVDQVEAGDGRLANGGDLVFGEFGIAFEDQGGDRVLRGGADKAREGDGGARLGVVRLEGGEKGAGIEGGFRNDDHLSRPSSGAGWRWCPFRRWACPRKRCGHFLRA